MNVIYNEILKNLLEKPVVGNTRELLNVRFTINPQHNILTYRHLSLKYLLAEMIWYFAGKNDVKFIGQFADLWNHLTDDGVTNNSAYGYILKEAFEFDQIEQVIKILQNDPLSRRAVININTPHNHKFETKDEPCTIALQFYLRKGKLSSTSVMRSNDVWFGLPYDIVFFTELNQYIARRLKVETGKHTHFVTSLHMYLKDEEKIKEVINNFETKNKKEYKINFRKLINRAEDLYNKINKDNIIEICKEEGII